jgi:RNA recognition motif-containing protein
MNSEYKVFVKGIQMKSESSNEMEETKKMLFEHFEKCGKVTRVFIKSDYAFVNFETEEARDAALKLKGSYFQEKSIDVCLAKDQRTENTKRDYKRLTSDNDAGWSKPEVKSCNTK